MQACLAALSQGVPAVGLAYSRKFNGVFETLGWADAVLDQRGQHQTHLVAVVMERFAQRDSRRRELEAVVARAAAEVREAFREMCGAGEMRGR